MTSNLDLLLTLAALTRTKTPEDRKMDGHKLSPVLSDEGKALKIHFTVGHEPDYMRSDPVPGSCICCNANRFTMEGWLPWKDPSSVTLKLTFPRLTMQPKHIPKIWQGF